MFKLLRYSRLIGLLAGCSALSLLAACSYTNAADENPPKPCNMPDVVSYATDVQPIFQANCVECHNSSYPGSNAGFYMSDFKAVQYWATTKKGSTGLAWMVGNVEHAPGFIGMPYQRGMLSECDVAIIKAWCEAGAPQN